MRDTQFRDFMDLLMCSDPWPVLDGTQDSLIELADEESKKRGYENWIVAFHEFKSEAALATQAFQKPSCADSVITRMRWTCFQKHSERKTLFALGVIL